MSSYFFQPYVSVGKRRADAAKRITKMTRQGVSLSPVQLTGRAIASTFWGKAWCKQIESFSDYENRLPRGRSYVRNNAVIDLQVAPGKVTALVMGSSVYEQTISITPISPGRWQSIKGACSGQIDSLVELLQGRLSDGVMSVITHRQEGMFPLPVEIKMDCSCPDWAGLCKHLAAVLYGIGARLDSKPELLFTLRGADHTELITGAVSIPASPGAAAAGLDDASLAEVFGIEIDTGAEEQEPPVISKPKEKRKEKKPPMPAKAVKSGSGKGREQRPKSEARTRAKGKNTNGKRRTKPPGKSKTQAVGKKRTPAVKRR
jgi:uncharacterized Zn finger protein